MNYFFKIFLIIFLNILSINIISASQYFKDNIDCEGLEIIDQYACLTEHAVNGIEIHFTTSKKYLKPDEITILKAIETMQLVQNIAGSGRFLFKKQQKNFTLPSMLEQSICLTKHFGICGNHQHLFVEILKRIGVNARPVDFYYSIDNQKLSHAAAEVEVNNKWLYFDITWGSIWLDQPNNFFKLMSINEILSGKGTRVTSINSWQVAQNQLNQDPFSYLNAKDLQLLINKGGLMTFNILDNKIDFADRPNYFGKTLNNQPLKLKITGSNHIKEAIIDISGIGGTCDKSFMKIGGNRYLISLGRKLITIPPNAILEVKGKDSVCYLVINNIELDPKIIDLTYIHKLYNTQITVLNRIKFKAYQHFLI